MSERYRVPGRRREVAIYGLAAALGCAALAGCSIGGAAISDDGPAATGSVAKVAEPSPLSSDLGQEDWRRAKNALAVALDPQGSGAAVKWDNPDTRVSGTFTPVAQPYVKANEICRAFIATLNRSDETLSLQGSACRVAAEEWRLSDVKPWRKPG